MVESCYHFNAARLSTRFWSIHNRNSQQTLGHCPSVVSIGACSVGVIAIGAFSVGVVSIGAFSVGIFAFGGNSFGIIAIGARTRHGYEVGPRGRFDIGRVVGVIAIGPKACGVYTLSYEGKGVHVLSPDRQDVDAVALFTRWLPKFKGVLSPAS